MMNRHAASGIDGQSTEQFASEMEQRVEEICAQLKEGTYRAPPVRRVEIPKGRARSERDHWGFPLSLTGCCSGRSRAFSRLCLKPISSIAATAFDQGATLSAERRAERGQGKPETFDFLVLTHYCTTRKDGTDFQLGRKTQRKRTKAKLREIIAHRPWRAGCGRRVDISGSSLADTKGASIGVPPSFRKRSRGSARGRIPLKTTSWSRVSPKPRLVPATTKTMTMRQRSYPNDPRRPPPGL
jgi:hypothetical protein